MYPKKKTKEKVLLYNILHLFSRLGMEEEILNAKQETVSTSKQALLAF